MADFISQLPIYQLLLLVVFIVSFVAQIIYWLRYSSIASFRSRQRVSKEEGLPSVSVIVIVEESSEYIEQGLLLLLEQQHPQYEVIVVNDCGGPEVDYELEALCKKYKHLKFTTIRKDKKFRHSRKIPLVVGIKAAKYDNLIVTDCDAVPRSPLWLSFMCRGFAGADLVIGYTGFEIKEDLTNKLARCTRLQTSIRYLKSAINGKPYRGIYNNIGYTKSMFFDSRGYTDLSMTIGEDDLFVQKLEKIHCVTSVIINPQSTLIQHSPYNLSSLWHELRYRTYSVKMFPYKVKIKLFFEVASQLLLLLSGITLIVLSALQIIPIPYLWVGAIVLLVIRELCLLNGVRKISQRLGEENITTNYMLYDIISPFFEIALAISRRKSPPQKVWIQNKK